MPKRRHKKSKIVGESTPLPDEDTSEAAPLGELTKHIVQPFRMMPVRTKNNRNKSVLTPVAPLSVVSEEAARERAERMFETGSYTGIDAYTVTGNPFIGEYGEPAFHVRLGNVPRHDGWE